MHKHLYPTRTRRSGALNYGRPPLPFPAALQVLTPSVRQLVTSTLSGEPTPEFVEKVPRANKVVVACVSGLGMANADKSMAEGVRERRAGGVSAETVIC